VVVVVRRWRAMFQGSSANEEARTRKKHEVLAARETALFLYSPTFHPPAIDAPEIVPL